MNTENINVIVSHFNNNHLIKKLLDSITGVGFDIIVVDDHSEPDQFFGLLELSKEYNDVRIFQLEYSKGFGSHVARNSAAAIAERDYLLFIDADMVLTKGVIDELNNTKLSKDKLIHFLTRIYVDFKDTGTFISRNVGRLTIENKFYNKYYEWNYKKQTHINTFLISKERFIKVGGYDKELWWVREGDRLIVYKLLESGLNRKCTNNRIICNLISQKYKRDNNLFIENINISYIKNKEYVDTVFKVINKSEYNFNYIGLKECLI